MVLLAKKQHGSFFTFPIPFLQAVYNSGKATIQARLIILELTRILATHRWRFAMNLNLSGASDSFFFQWCPNLEEAEDAARYCAIILSRWVEGGQSLAMTSSKGMPSWVSEQ